MLYRINLDDDSFIFADENYKMTLFKRHKKKIVTIKEYVTNSKYWKYHMLDEIDNKKIKRYFRIDRLPEQNNLELYMGSRIKLAKDIKLNDLVVAPDGSPRKVKELHTGQEEMYEITVNGSTYTVNGGHILALIDKETEEHLEIPVNIFMHMKDDFKSKFVMERIIDVH